MAIEHTLYTWDPVSAAWVHERGPKVPPPPSPPDVHALQSYFFDAESKEWIRRNLFLLLGRRMRRDGRPPVVPPQLALF